MLCTRAKVRICWSAMFVYELVIADFGTCESMITQKHKHHDPTYRLDFVSSFRTKRKLGHVTENVTRRHNLME